MAHDRDFELGIYNHRAEAAPAGSLFETFADKVLRRADDVLAGRECPWPPVALEIGFLQLLRTHQGKGRIVPLGLFAERLHTSPREIKKIVQSLCLNFGVQVGRSRDSEDGGYYLIATYEESVESTEQMLRQATSMLRVVSKMRGGRDGIDSLLTQLRLDLTQEAA